MSSVSQFLKSQQDPQGIDIAGKILLVCDFTGKIVFWKGDSNLLGKSSAWYLGSNFFQLNWSIYSRMVLTSKLTADIFKTGQREQFKLELIKDQFLYQSSEAKKPKKRDQRSIKRQFHQYLKTVWVNASCIYGEFFYQSYLSFNEASVNFIENNTENYYEQSLFGFDSNSNMQKFLMFQMEQKIQVETSQEKPSKKIKPDFETQFSDMDFIKKNNKPWISSIEQSNGSRFFGKCKQQREYQDVNEDERTPTRSPFRRVVKPFNFESEKKRGMLTRSKRKGLFLDIFTPQKNEMRAYENIGVADLLEYLCN